MTSTQWQLKNQAQAVVGNENDWLEIDLTQPTDGLHFKTKEADSSSEANLFQLNIATSSSQLVDCYLRGDDVIATIQDPVANDQDDTLQHSFRRQIYWRCDQSMADTQDCLGVQMILSSQTSCLESDPIIHSQTRLQATELLQLTDVNHHDFVPLEHQSRGDQFQPITTGPACFLIRTNHRDFSYVEMIHPVDFRQSEYSFFNHQCCLRHPIFGHQLEKGVILRARLQGVFLPSESDEQRAAKIYQQWITSKIPLTV